MTRPRCLLPQRRVRALPKSAEAKIAKVKENIKFETTLQEMANE
jgi:hypothetical protein